MSPRTLAALAALSLPLSLTAACADTSMSATDFAGYTLPAECRGDLSYVEATITPVAPSVLEQMAVVRHLSGGKRLNGLQMGKRILIDETLRGWKRDSLIQHERCHVLLGAWHQ